MLKSIYATPQQVKTFCPSCNSFYMDFVSNVNVNNEKGGVKFYYATCYRCLNDRQKYEIYLAWQKLVFVNKTLSFNLSPLYTLYK